MVGVADEAGLRQSDTRQASTIEDQLPRPGPVRKDLHNLNKPIDCLVLTARSSEAVFESKTQFP